jgi:hypothetical protein
MYFTFVMRYVVNENVFLPPFEDHDQQDFYWLLYLLIMTLYINNNCLYKHIKCQDIKFLKE